MQPGWTDITFDRREAYPPRTTVSWAISDNHGNVRKMNIHISKSLLEVLKWSVSQHFLIFLNEDGTTVVITPGRVGKKMRFKRSGSCFFALHMPHVKAQDTIPAQPTKHTIVGDSLHVALPDWAMVSGQKITITHPARPMHRSIMSVPDPAAALRGGRR